MILDYKRSTDGVNKNEHIAYTDISKRLCPVLVLYEDENNKDSFSVRAYINGAIYFSPQRVTWEHLNAARVYLDIAEAAGNVSPLTLGEQLIHAFGLQEFNTERKGG